ncbi:alpha-galactosidase [Pelagirhabdus alkalitolerans]|uniref:Alpha-galactosidase n=1 Tax=Pelagirhabdus alkalitolerans TaxID=1612202 RepID=A0A1G6KXP1_9BACI|nr:alpha-galactosidase [Pelagirhabdus alkalitolerans]SDC35588.1 alpha-galactosidase [Pelagirhabdus alkalitolerans]
MPIYVNENEQVFHLQSSKVSYIFTVLENNQLGHLYFGKRLINREHFDELYYIEETPHTCFVEGCDHTFSLDLIKQEYPSYGTTDFRDPAHQITQANGSRITDFKFVDYKIYKGKKGLEGLPATYVENDNEATTTDVRLFDRVMKTELVLSYTVFENLGVITRSARFVNQSDQTIQLDRVMSASFDLPDADFDLLHLSGSWARERHVKERPLTEGIQSISSARGISSTQHNPFIALKRENTTETSGDVYGLSFVYSGNFLAQVEVDHYEKPRVMMGINPFDFSWQLKPDASFQTPEVVMVFSENGLNGMSQDYHTLYRTRLAKGQWRDQLRPVLMNNWEGTYFDFTEEKILDMAKEAKSMGVELFVLDDGWFGKRDDDTSSLGDWFVDKRKLPNGMKHLAQSVKDLGLLFGLWFEPEMVSPVSKLFETHPDWVIRVDDRPMSHGRNQYILDFSRQEVVDYLYERMAEMLQEAPIDYVKWDMNRYMTEIGSLNLTAASQQELPHRYLLGVYQLYDRLTTAFPHVLFESCASGGARFDPGMLYYAPQAWTSDDTDAVERLNIQYGTSFVYPLSIMGAHVSDVPNHQTGRVTSLDMRATVAYFGMLGYELDPTRLSSEDKETMAKQIEFYKANQALIQKGVFTRLLSPFEKNQNQVAWQVTSQDHDQLLVGFYQILSKPNQKLRRLKLVGLDPDAVYRLNGANRTFYGDQLMQVGLEIDRYTIHDHPADFQHELFKFYKVKE